MAITNEHKAVLDRCNELWDKGLREAVCDIWFCNKEETLEDLKITLIDEVITGYDEGNLFTDYVYNINGHLFIRQNSSNSWCDYYEDEEKLLPATTVMRECFEVIDE